MTHTNTMTLIDKTTAKTIATIATKSLASWLNHNGYKVYGYSRKDNQQAILVVKV